MHKLINPTKSRRARSPDSQALKWSPGPLSSVHRSLRGAEPPFRLCSVFEDSGLSTQPVAENRESQSLHNPSCIQIVF
ncbi:hypothetical protein MRB53_018558 [Persea americana]|uniref:Uncharacterized protein n=1 Tax=Persea americana TaxID=3435 RepID=A0ACC2M964_PERAE|nr:hypothetical protein MRB53_018558 [Persea americana]